jgi:hypothetical protein
VGHDLAGVERKLTDYQGKVVVVHLWNASSVLSARQIPQLVKLSQKHAADPFCILGINDDRNRKDAEKFAKENGMTWPSWDASDVGESIGRLIPLGSWADVIVVDPKGMLRYRALSHYDPTGDKLDNAVDAIVHELAQGGPIKR